MRRPVAVAALTLLLALSQRLFMKDGLTRSGRWDERLQHMGTGLLGRSLGVVGAGGIGQELLRLARPFGLNLLAADPHVAPDVLRALGAEPVDLNDLLAASDFVVILTPLTAATRGLIGADALRRMRRSAYLINVARGPVVDEAALVAALEAGQIAGAGLDVFEREPLDPASALLSLPQVIATPHCLGWTDQCFGGLAESGFHSIVEVLAGRVPTNAVNPEAARVAAR